MLSDLDARLKRVERSARLSHAALDNTAITVKDDTGTVRGHIGMQQDGTLGLVAVDGPAPGAPSAPTVTPSLGGLRVTWDGTLADGTALPADFDHVAVHMSTSSGFTPSAATFVGTITRSGDGGMLPVTPLPYTEHYTVLLAVNTSGAASTPSAQTAATPVQVDGPDLTAGSVTAAAIAAGAVTADKLEAILQLATRIVAGDPAGARVELNEDGLRVYNASGTLTIQFNASDGSGAFTGTITGSTITGGLIQTATSGERVTINQAGTNAVVIHNTSNVAMAELSARGALVKGTSGATIWLDPNATYPQLKLYNAAGTNYAVAQVGEFTTGEANLELLSGRFTSGAYTDMAWRHLLAKDFAVIERLRSGTPSTVIGGRLIMTPTALQIGLKNTDTPTQDTTLHMEANLSYFDNSRLQVLPPASAESALYIEAETGHTGALLRAYRGTDLFLIDKDGNTTLAGGLTVGTTSWGTWTPVINNGGTATYTVRDAWYYKLGKDVHVYAYITCSAAGSGTTGLTISGLPATPYRGPSANVRQHISIYLGGLAAGTNSTVSGHGIGLVQPTGSGAQLDQVRGPTDIQTRGENLSATATLTLNGWYREA
jgi:hypothetical protein